MQPPTLEEQNDAQQREQATERKTDAFQKEFDALLLWLIGLGLFFAMLYGASARTCMPDPQQSSPIAAASSDRPGQSEAGTPPVARPQPPPPAQAQVPGQPPNPPQGQARANVAAAPAAPATTTPRAPATEPARSGAPPRRAAETAALRAQCVGDGNGTVGALLALAIAMAALALGTVVGFLFGLPRSLTSSEFRAARRQAQNPGEAAPADTAGGSAGGSGSEVNTNLEKISDWLTTIIVGVGLTKLEQLPSALESFGDRVALYFGYGGKVFGIAGGLYFLIAGFFLAYVGTRVKLSLVFVWSQRTNQGAAMQTISLEAIRTSQSAPPIPGAGAPADNDQLKEADRQLLGKSLSDLKSTDEILAWANAKARNGDFASALAGYKDLWGRVPLTEKQQTDYATVLAAAGDTAGANNVVSAMATSGMAPASEVEARQKVAAAAQTGKAAELRSRLQQGLYKPPNERGYEDSIAAGEELMKVDDQAAIPLNHVWLASAYGQKLKYRSREVGETPTASQRAELAALRKRGVEEARKAALDPGTRQLVRSLYDPALQVADDDDLQSLAPDLDDLFQDEPPGQA